MGERARSAHDFVPEGRQPHRNGHAWKEEVGGCVDRVDRDVHDVPHVASAARGEEQCVACTELAEAGGGGGD